MEKEIKEGSVVILNSGGPTMTVKFVENKMVHCIWFSDNWSVIPCASSFPIDCLKLFVSKKE
jgi:uncharacterized protein YodC (DUF2158 family)